MNPFFKWLTGKRDASRAVDISCAKCVAAWQEVAVRELCLQSCIDMVANAIGRCEVRTFAGGREVQDREYYMLNVEPNVNQNSSAFWHKVISQLYRHNEALIINTTTRDGRECLVCADSFSQEGDYPAKMNTYKGVVVGQVAYNKTFRENEVIHLKLNERNIRPVLEALASSYDKLISAAEAYYVAANGVHIKAHVDAIAQQSAGDDLTAWQAKFAESLKKVVVPFLQSGNGVLPEFDGYHYERMELAAGGSAQSSQELRALVEDVFNFTARAFLIPAVLVNGAVEGTADANKRFLTYVIDPLCDQIQEELNRKRYGYDLWKRGTFVRMDSSSIIHFDIFENAANIEKVVGSGIFSLNDVLRAANQNPIPADWADKHYMTLNISEMGNQTRQLESGGG